MLTTTPRPWLVDVGDCPRCKALPVKIPPPARPEPEWEVEPAWSPAFPVVPILAPVAKRPKGDGGITLARLWQRDGNLCALCDLPMWRCVSWKDNDPLHASIDHVIPLSRGGPNTWANTRLVHRICNTRKQVRQDIGAGDVEEMRAFVRWALGAATR